MSDKPKEQTRYEKLRNLYMIIPEAHAGIDVTVSKTCQDLFAKYKIAHDTRILIEQCVLEFYLTGHLFLLPEANWQMLDPDKIGRIVAIQKPSVQKSLNIVTGIVNNESKEILQVMRCPMPYTAGIVGHSALMFWDDQSFAKVDMGLYDDITIAMRAIYGEPFDDLPLYVNDTGLLGDIARWRLKLGQ